MYDIDKILDSNNERLRPDRTYIIDEHGNLVRKRHRARATETAVKLPSASGGLFLDPARSDLSATVNRRRARADGLVQMDGRGTRIYDRDKPREIDASVFPLNGDPNLDVGQRATSTYSYRNANTSGKEKIATDYIGPRCSPFVADSTPAPQTYTVPFSQTEERGLNDQAYSRSRRRVKQRCEKELSLDGRDINLNLPKRHIRQGSPLDVFIDGEPVERKDTDLEIEKRMKYFEQRRSSPVDLFIDGILVDRKQERALEKEKRNVDLTDRIKNSNVDRSDFSTYAVRHKQVDDSLDELLRGIDDIMAKDKQLDCSSKTTGGGFGSMVAEPELTSRFTRTNNGQETFNTSHMPTSTSSRGPNYSPLVSPIAGFRDYFDSELQEAIVTQKRFAALDEKVKKFKNACRQCDGPFGRNRGDVLKGDTVDYFLNDLDDVLKTPTPEFSRLSMEDGRNIKDNVNMDNSASITTSFSNNRIAPRMTNAPMKQWNGQTAKRGVGFKSKLKKEGPIVKTKRAAADLIPEKIKREMAEIFGGSTN